jgi:hypothetical protein
METRGGSLYQYGGPGTVYLNSGVAGGELWVSNGGNNGPAAALLAGDYQIDIIRLTNYGHLTVLGSGSVITVSNSSIRGDGTSNLNVGGTIVAPIGFTVEGVYVGVQGQLQGPEYVTTTTSGGLRLYASTPWRSGVYTFHEVHIGTNTTMRLVPQVTNNAIYTDDYGIELQVDRLTIEAGGLLSADGQGY